MHDQLNRIAVKSILWQTDPMEELRGMRTRLSEERGQTAAEYLGIILLVAVIIAAVVGSGIAGDIKTRIVKLVENIGKGTPPSGAPSPDGAG